MAGLNEKWISRTTWKGSPMNIQIRNLKGILEEWAVNAALVVCDTGLLNMYSPSLANVWYYTTAL